jgi:hypothetical protein
MLNVSTNENHAVRSKLERPVGSRDHGRDGMNSHDGIPSTEYTDLRLFDTRIGNGCGTGNRAYL